MTTLSTHDTKRSEDTRARIGVLSELPREWSALVARPARRRRRRTAARWSTAAPSTCCGRRSPGPGRDDGPIAADRLTEYLTKAMREAKNRTTWTAPDEAYEAAVLDAARQALERPRRRRAVRRLGAAHPAGGAGRDARHQARPADAAGRRRRLPGHRGARRRRWSTRTTGGRSTLDGAGRPARAARRRRRRRATWPTRSCWSPPGRCGCDATCRRRSSDPTPASCRSRTPPGNALTYARTVAGEPARRGRRDPARRRARPARRLGGPHASRCPTAPWHDVLTDRRGRRRRRRGRRRCSTGCPSRCWCGRRHERDARVWAPSARARRPRRSASSPSPPVRRRTAGGPSTGDLPHGTDYAFSVDGGPPRPDPRSAWQPAGRARRRAACSTPAALRVDGRGVGRASTCAATSSTSCTSARSRREGTLAPPSTTSTSSSRSASTSSSSCRSRRSTACTAGATTASARYAVHEPYGGPAALQEFVDEAHARGLGGLPRRRAQPPGPVRQLPRRVRPVLHRRPPHAVGRRGQPRRRRARRGPPLDLRQRAALVPRLPRRRPAPRRRARAARRLAAAPARAAVRRGRRAVRRRSAARCRSIAESDLNDPISVTPDGRRRLGHDRRSGPTTCTTRSTRWSRASGTATTSTSARPRCCARR